MSLPCRDISVAPVCYKSAAGLLTTLQAHYEYRTSATGGTLIHATRYTDAAGVPFDTSAGTVSAGSCPVAQPDVEFERLCDVSAAGVVTEFMRRTITIFDSATGAIIPLVADFQLDHVTAYAVTGTVTTCDSGCDVVAPVGVLVSWG
jgi:hypothetical protein